MPLGFPDVTPIRDRSEVALRVQQIRQRLSALDAEVTRLGAVADASAVAAQVTSLTRAAQQLALRVSALEGALGTTDTLALAAGEAIVSGQVIVPGEPNQCLVADPSDPRARNTVLGIALNGGAIGQSITIQRRGQLTISGAAFEAGRPVFLGLAGTVTQDPTYASAAVVVGVAMSATVMWIGAGDPTLLAPTNYPDPFDDAMPVSWGVVRDLVEGSVGGPFQPLDSDLTDIAALATTAYGRSLLTLADANALGASFVIENRTSDPGSPATGQIWLRTDL